MSDKTRSLPAIFGGKIALNEFPSLLENLEKQNGFPYRVFESMDRIEFGDDSLKPGNIEEFVRGRIFGSDGDLALRRDGTLVRWWFVSESSKKLPDGVVGEDFWKKSGSDPTAYHVNERRGLLWGELASTDGDPFWFDDRVANAILRYPVEEAGERMLLVFDAITCQGRLEFTRYKRVEKA
jgi:hypothetical protein